MSVTLLTRSGCGLCDEARSLLVRLANEFPLAIAVVDVDLPNGAALAAESRVLFTPGILIGTEAVASGRVTERRLREAIARRLGYSLMPDSGPADSGPRWLHRGWTLVGWLTRSW